MRYLPVPGTMVLSGTRRKPVTHPWDTGDAETMQVGSWWESSTTFRRCTAEKVSFIVLSELDLGLTLLAIYMGFTELNPLVEWMIGVPFVLLLVKCILPVLVAWAIPGRLLWPSIVLMALVVIWNVKELVIFLF